MFSLVYLPFEELPYEMPKKYIYLNGHLKDYYADEQRENRSHHCRHVNMKDGRCNIHGKQPFSCDFEILRVLKHKENNILMTKLFGRGWNMLRVDDNRGALCEITPMSKEDHKDIIRRLERLKAWADYFEFTTHAEAILSWVKSGPHEEPLILQPEPVY